MTSAIYHEIIAFKMGIIEKQMGHLQTLIDNADKVLKAGSSWLTSKSEESGITYKVIDQMIEDMIAQLCTKCTGIPEKSEEKTISKEFKEAKSSPTASTQTEQWLPLENYKISAESELKTLAAQVKVMQEAIASLISNAEKHTAMRERLKSLSAKYFRIEEEQNRNTESLGEVERELQEVIVEQKRYKMWSKKELQQCGKNMGTIQENIKGINARVGLVEIHADDLQHKVLKLNIESFKKHSETLPEKVEEHSPLLQELTKRIDDSFQKAQQERSEEIQKFEEKIDALEVKCQEVSKESEKLCNDVKNKLDRNSDQVADVMSKFSQHDEECDEHKIGFSASQSEINLLDAKWITTYTRTVTNLGNHFDAAKGIFTAPVNGMYAVSLSAAFYSESVLSIVKLPEGYNLSTDDFNMDNVLGLICRMEGGGVSSVSSVVELNSGEKLCVFSPDEGECLLTWVTFSCFKIA